MSKLSAAATTCRQLLDNGYAELAVTGAHTNALATLAPLHKDADCAGDHRRGHVADRRRSACNRDRSGSFKCLSRGKEMLRSDFRRGRVPGFPALDHGGDSAAVALDPPWVFRQAPGGLPMNFLNARLKAASDS
jgi:hypothetical protein